MGPNAVTDKLERPGFSDQNALAQLRISVRRRWVGNKIYLYFVSATMGIIIPIMMLLEFLYIALKYFSFDPPNPHNPYTWVPPFLAYVAYFILPVVVSLPFMVLIALTWRDPRRIVLFRRFNTVYENKLLRKIIARHLSRFGHVFTLADSQIHLPWNVRIPILLGQLSFVHFRPRKITDKKQVAGLRRLLGQRWRLNINWMVSFRKIFAIQSSDECWQSCVRLLLDKADLVVADISNLHTSLLWEIAECRRLNLISRVVFLCSTQKRVDGLAWIAEAQREGVLPANVPVFVYSAKGLEDNAALQQCVMQMLSRMSTSSPPAPTTEITLGLGVTLLFSLVLASIAAFVTSPYAFTTQAIRYSPFEWQVMHAYLYGNGGDEALTRLERDFRETALKQLLNYTSSEIEFYRESGVQALGLIGDERAIPRLYALGEGSARRALVALIKRRGKQAAILVLEEIARDSLLRNLSNSETVYDLGFLRIQTRGGPLYELYELIEAIQEQMSEAEIPLLNRLLDSPSEAGRYIAALELAPREDMRIIPILLEIVRKEKPHYAINMEAMYPLWGIRREHLASLVGTARGILERFLKTGVPRLDPKWVDAFILGDDEAAIYAAKLAVTSADETYAVELLKRVGPNEGGSILSVLGDALGSREADITVRGERLLVEASTPWLMSFLTAKDDKIRLAAAYSLANRGEVVSLRTILEFSLKKGEDICFNLFGGCPPYEGIAQEMLDRLLARLRPPQRIDIDLREFHDLNLATRERVVKIAAKSRDSRVILQALLWYPVSIFNTFTNDFIQFLGEHLDAKYASELDRIIKRGDLRLEEESFLASVAKAIRERRAKTFVPNPVLHETRK